MDKVVKRKGLEIFEREKSVLWKIVIKFNLLKKFEKYYYFFKF